MQPFLLTSYYEICRERGNIRLADMFQSDLVWEVDHDELEKVRGDLSKYDGVEKNPAEDTSNVPEANILRMRTATFEEPTD